MLGLPSLRRSSRAECWASESIPEGVWRMESYLKRGLAVHFGALFFFVLIYFILFITVFYFFRID